KLDIDIHDAQLGERIPELEALPLRGVPFWDETVLYHGPTQTLLGADIVLRADAKDHWTWRYAARITGCYERVRVPPRRPQENPGRGRGRALPSSHARATRQTPRHRPRRRHRSQLARPPRPSLANRRRGSMSRSATPSTSIRAHRNLGHTQADSASHRPPQTQT